MTIQAAFNEITETLGGTPSTDGTITGAIDALNDTLAGENQERGTSIENGIRLLGEHIGKSSFTATLNSAQNGSYDVLSATEAEKSYGEGGDTVLIPAGELFLIDDWEDEGYQLKTITVVTIYDNAPLPLEPTEGKYVMPAMPIEITVTFQSDK